MSMQELEASRASLSSKEEELKAVKKENRKRRKVIEAYQDMMNAGATGLHAVSSHIHVHIRLSGGWGLPLLFEGH